jgi:predicted transcriptional regulator of viral defense system
MNMTLQKTAATAVLDALAAEQRTVFSDWRALILLRQMRTRGEIQPVPGCRDVFQVIVPYARQIPLDERAVLFELHPYAVLSHQSALVFHGLTDEQPKGLTATVSKDGSGGLYPIGTAPRDWEGVPRPAGRRPAAVVNRPVQWNGARPERFFGFLDYEPFGFPMRYTTPERTLIDGLQQPELCGGIGTVLRAWILARPILDLDVLVYQVERYGVAILRQRAGYVMEQLGLTHARLDAWQRAAKRGGSSRFVGSAPFASRFDERWNISLNAPVELLREPV